jgi:hypothetical protein
MKKKISQLRKIFAKIMNNTAFITLFAITLGVLLAFYLNGLSESSSKQIKVNKAYSNIVIELESNKKKVLGNLVNDSTIIVLDKIRKYDVFLKGEIITSSKKIDSIMDQINVAKFVDSLNLEQGVVKYFVNYNNLQFAISSLPNVAWEAAQIADLTNEFEYECLATIIDIYNLQDLLTAEEYKLLGYFADEKYNQFYRTLGISRGLRRQLLEKYEETIIDIKNCN